MNILHITSKLPWPLIDGARICMYRTVEGLAALGHEIQLVCFDEQYDDPGPLASMARVEVIPLKVRPNAVGALLTLGSRRPYTQLKREVAAAYPLLDRLHAERRFDVVLADEIHIASYGAYMKRRHGVPYLLRTHNVEYEIYRRHTDTVGNPLMRAYLELQTARWRRFEVEQFALADALAAITGRDRAMIEEMAPGCLVRTVPAAVDLEAFPYHGADGRESASMVMLGDMKWPPNRDAALWFTREILPLVVEKVPDAVLYLLGGNPPTAQLPAPSGNLRIEGRVPEVAPYFERAALGLIPLRVGGGMRVKMIEMMSAGMPIVSTTQGAEGNEAADGEHFVRADDAASFAAAIVRLLGDAAERDRLARAGRSFVEQHYALAVVARSLESLLGEAIARATGQTARATAAADSPKAPDATPASDASVTPEARR
jgi:glycosyltransferase involved in cell wall biosynthesis